MEYASLAQHYLRASIRDPRKAIDRVARLRSAVSPGFDARGPRRLTPAVAAGGLSWTPATPGATLTVDGDVMMLVTDETPAATRSSRR